MTDITALAPVTGNAYVSAGGHYRYWLTREWGEASRRACFVMLNPSTADAENDDPTLRRCLRFTRDFGYNALSVVNLFAWRATDPTEVFAACASPDDRARVVGPENRAFILREAARSEIVILAWGVLPKRLAWHADAVTAAIARQAEASGKEPPRVLAMTDSGYPRHPLYCRADCQPVPYDKAWADYLKAHSKKGKAGL